MLSTGTIITGKRDDMVTVTCNSDGCPNGAIPFNVGGFPEFVECGGCDTHLARTDPRADPEPVDDFPDPPA